MINTDRVTALKRPSPSTTIEAFERLAAGRRRPAGGGSSAAPVTAPNQERLLPTIIVDENGFPRAIIRRENPSRAEARSLAAPMTTQLMLLIFAAMALALLFILSRSGG